MNTSAPARVLYPEFPNFPESSKVEDSELEKIIEKLKALTLSSGQKTAQSSIKGSCLSHKLSYSELPEKTPTFLKTLCVCQRRFLFSHPAVCEQAWKMWLCSEQKAMPVPEQLLEAFMKYCDDPVQLVRFLEDCAERVKNWVFSGSNVNWVPDSTVIALIKAMRHLPLWKVAVAYFDVDKAWVSELKHHRISRLLKLMKRVNGNAVDTKLSALLGALPTWRYYGHRLVLGPLKSAEDGIDQLPALKGITVCEIKQLLFEAIEQTPENFLPKLVRDAPKLTLAIVGEEPKYSKKLPFWLKE